MNAQSKRKSVSTHKMDKLLRLLNEQHRVLVASAGDKQLVSEHSALIRFLKSASPQELQHIFSPPPVTSRAPQPLLDLKLSETELVDIPTGEVEKIIENESTPRKYLESIAIHRFKVPRGSVRSFSNRSMLVEKLLSMLRNEQVHREIETVARRHV